MREGYDTALWAARRRPLERLEGAAVRAYLDKPDQDARPILEAIRYALGFAKLWTLEASDGTVVDVSEQLEQHAAFVRDALAPRLKTGLWEAAGELPEVLRRTRDLRKTVLQRVDRDALEGEVTTRLLAVASGGGGGAGYVYPGSYEMLERGGLTPDIMAGTSIGALMSMFRCRRRRWDIAPLVAAARQLSWSKVFQVLETENRYGLPATLRLYLRQTLGQLFRHDSGRQLWLSDMEIPLYIVATGITVDALKHDLDYYEHLLDSDLRRRVGVRGGIKAVQILREFLGRRDALREVVLGRAEGTEDFDVLDAAGFSASIPAVIHYDVLRDDPRMKGLLDRLYAAYGITRLGEGGMVSNVPARILWETAVSGKLQRRNVFVLALDCFAPNSRKLAWLPFQQLVRTANVEADRAFADCYVPYSRTPSPVNLVPSIRDALTAIRWGREAIEPRMPYIKEMMRPVAVLGD